MQYTKRLLPAAALMFALPAAPGGEIAVLKTGYRPARRAPRGAGPRACGCLRPAGGNWSCPLPRSFASKPDGAAPERPAVRQRPAAEKTAAGKPLSVAAAVDRFAARSRTAGGIDPCGGRGGIRLPRRRRFREGSGRPDAIDAADRGGTGDRPLQSDGERPRRHRLFEATPATDTPGATTRSSGRLPHTTPGRAAWNSTTAFRLTAKPGRMSAA